MWHIGTAKCVTNVLAIFLTSSVLYMYYCQ